MDLLGPDRKVCPYESQAAQDTLPAAFGHWPKSYFIVGWQHLFF